MESQVFRTLAELIAATAFVETDTITRATTFDDIGLDSLDVVEMGIDIEDEFQISLDDDLINEMKTVGELVEYVEKLVN